MATKPAAKTETETPEEMMGPPEGFTEAAPDVDGWFKAEKGAVFYGQIVGHMMVNGDNGKRDVVMVRLAQPCKGYGRDDENGRMLEKGEVLGVSVSAKLKPMLLYVEKRGHVWCQAIEKIKLGGNKTLWKYDLRFKGQKAALVRQAEDQQYAEIPTDDLPF